MISRHYLIALSAKPSTSLPSISHPVLASPLLFSVTYSLPNLVYCPDHSAQSDLNRLKKLSQARFDRWPERRSILIVCSAQRLPPSNFLCEIRPRDVNCLSNWYGDLEFYGRPAWRRWTMHVIRSATMITPNATEMIRAEMIPIYSETRLSTDSNVEMEARWPGTDGIEQNELLYMELRGERVLVKKCLVSFARYLQLST